VALLVSPLSETMIAPVGRRKEVERIDHVHDSHCVPPNMLGVGHVVEDGGLGDALNVFSEHLPVMLGTSLCLDSILSSTLIQFNGSKNVQREV
jgi:hypothetical protein